MYSGACRFGVRAAALGHLGRNDVEAAAEARRSSTSVRANWFGDLPASNEAMVRWLLHLYPIRRREDWERLRDGSRRRPTDSRDGAS